MARRTGIRHAKLWISISFNLAAIHNPRDVKTVLPFLDRRLDLGIDFGDLDEEVRIRTRDPGSEERLPWNL